MSGLVMVTKGGGYGVGGGGCGKGSRRGCAEEQNQLSMVAVLLAAIRKSLVSCRIEESEDGLVGNNVNQQQMEIGWPINVQHITHVTFDRFNGFLGLPVEFQLEIPCRAPSASASVFGVSAESMQCSYDSKGNSVPTILLLMQERLYSQGGLKAEGIFRINPENGQEEHVRDQLNRGIVSDDIDVHCLAGLIKAWFRELPSGVLDGLSPEQVLQSNTEEEYLKLVKQLKPTEVALLNWAVDLMADVVQEEGYNKMNARNIAMVFSPNMTQMSDPLTALMHAVQVMNLLKTLIMKTLREREETATGGYSPMSSHISSIQTEEDLYSPQEMDTSCELRQVHSDYDYHVHSDSNSEEDVYEVESLDGIEEHFLRQLDEKMDPSSDLPKDKASPGSWSKSKTESGGVSFTDSKNESSISIASDGEEDLRASNITVSGSSDRRSPEKQHKDEDETDKVTDSHLPRFLCSQSPPLMPLD